MPNLIENPYFNVDNKLENYRDFTEYTMTEFSDRVVELPWTFELVPLGQDQVSGNQIVHLKFKEGEVIEDGTDLSAMNLGNMDVGIAVLYEWIKYLKETIFDLMMLVEGVQSTTLNGMIANAYSVSFYNLDNIEIVRGYYDATKGEVWG